MLNRQDKLCFLLAFDYNTRQKGAEMILVVGEILFDIFPDKKRLGGAPFNFAFHLKKLGFDVRFVSRVGDDKPGKEILAFLDSHGFDTRDIQVDPDHLTGQVMVDMDDENNHSFQIVTPAAYDFLEYDARLSSLAEQDRGLIYYGSLIQRTRKGARTIHALLSEKQPSVQTFCDINLRPDCWTPESVDTCLKQADLLKLNYEELAVIAPSSLSTAKPAEIAAYLIKEYHLKAILLTLGEKGSVWFDRNRQVRSLPANNDLLIKDTVGAGDAYAAMAMAGCLSGWEPQKALNLAQDFAGGICGLSGALPESNKFYRPYIQLLLGR